MTCASDCTCCGRGTGGLLPNDPNMDDIAISAVAGFTGVTVTWTHPAVNAHALAFVIVYRSAGNDFTNATQLTITGGNYFFDRSSVLVPTLFYYWVKGVSVNGTIGSPRGPVTATMAPLVDDIVAAMVNSVSRSQLVASLQSELDSITDISSSLAAETQQRLFGTAVFDSLLSDQQAALAAVDTLVVNETIERINGNSALVAQVDFILAKSGDNAAAVLTETAARASSDSALALQITTLQSTVGPLSTKVSEHSSSIDGIEGNYSVKIDNNGHVSGFGLLSTLVDDAPFADFTIIADRFAIVSPGSTPDAPIVPFVMTAGELSISSNVNISGDLITSGLISAERIQVGVGGIALTSSLPTTLSQLTNNTGFVNTTEAAAASPVQSVGGHSGAIAANTLATTLITAGSIAITSQIPTAVSELSNDSAFVDASGAAAAAPVQSVAGATGTILASTIITAGNLVVQGEITDFITGGEVNANVTSISGGTITTGSVNANRINIDGLTLSRSGDSLVVNTGGVNTTQLALKSATALELIVNTGTVYKETTTYGAAGTIFNTSFQSSGSNTWMVITLPVVVNTSNPGQANDYVFINVSLNGTIVYVGTVPNTFFLRSLLSFNVTPNVGTNTILVKMSDGVFSNATHGIANASISILESKR